MCVHEIPVNYNLYTCMHSAVYYSRPVHHDRWSSISCMCIHKIMHKNAWLLCMHRWYIIQPLYMQMQPTQCIHYILPRIPMHVDSCVHGRICTCIYLYTQETTAAAASMYNYMNSWPRWNWRLRDWYGGDVVSQRNIHISHKHNHHALIEEEMV